MATVSWYPQLPIVDEVDQIVARWKAFSHSVNPALSDDMWNTPACRALVAAIVAGDDPTPALRRYASQREFACVLQSEAIADLTCLVSVEPRAEILDTLAAGAEIADAFRSAATESALDGLAGLPGLPYMLERLDEEYRRVLASDASPAAALELRRARAIHTACDEPGRRRHTDDIGTMPSSSASIASRATATSYDSWRRVQ